MEEQINQQQHLRDYWEVIRKRKWTLVTFFIVLVTAVTIGTFKIQPVYMATCQVLIEKERFKGITFSESIGIETSQQDYYQTQYKIIKSRSLAKKVVDKLKLDEFEEYSGGGDVVSSFLANVTVSPIRNSRLVNINVASVNQQNAALLANSLAEVYINENIKNRFIKNDTGSAIIGKNPYEQMEEISNGGKNIESLPSVLNNRLIQTLKGEYSKYEAKYAELSKRYKAKHPQIIEVKAAMGVMKEKINLEMMKVVESIKTELSGVLKGNNIRIIDRAEVPGYPIKPNKRANFIIAVFLGIFGGIGLAFFFEYIDNTVKTKDDVEKYLGLPFLGYVPIIKIGKKESPFKKHVFTDIEKKSFVAEAYRNVRANLVFSSVPEDLKTIVITSAGPGEGKTTTACNTAITLAHGGEKVIIVDADMRKPVLHRAFKLKNDIGLSNYLAGERDIDEVVRSTGINNLSVVTCGQIPPNPNELLGLDKMKEFISEALTKFDRIILDTPPIGAMSDGLILAKKADGVILVIQYKKLSKRLVGYGKEKINRIGAKIVGTVLNNFDIEREEHSSHPYYYYSYYGYSQQ